MEQHTRTIKNIMILFLIVVVFIIMGALSKILIPLFLAILFALMFQPIVNGMRHIKFPVFIIIPLIYIITLGGVYLVSSVMYSTGVNIADELPYLGEKFTEKLTAGVNLYNDITGSHVKANNLVNNIMKQVDRATIAQYAGMAASRITSFTSDFVMFALYYFLILAGMPRYKNFVRFVGGPKNGELLLENYEKIHKSIVNYMIYKSLINLFLGACVYFICVFFGIKFALFWGFLMFIFHFIPTVGAVVATIPPILMALLQFDNLAPVLIIVLALFGLQFVVGNILEPKLMGKQLKINTVSVLFGLVLWGSIWGVVGMLLSVPLMVLIKLILEQVEDFSYVSRLMDPAPKN